MFRHKMKSNVHESSLRTLFIQDKNSQRTKTDALRKLMQNEILISKRPKILIFHIFGLVPCNVDVKECEKKYYNLLFYHCLFICREELFTNNFIPVDLISISGDRPLSPENLFNQIHLFHLFYVGKRTFKQISTWSHLSTT